MRVEIFQELDTDDASLEIPWSSPTDPAVRYIDLKAFPEAIELLPECNRYPVLIPLLRLANAPESIFRTAKCDVWSTDDLAEDERVDFQLPWKVGSYVDLVFDCQELASKLEACLGLGEQIAGFFRPLRGQAQLEVALRRCLFHPHDAWGCAATIFVHAYGGAIREAEREWGKAVRALARSLGAADRVFRGAA